MILFPIVLLYRFVFKVETMPTKKAIVNTLIFSFLSALIQIGIKSFYDKLEFNFIEILIFVLFSISTFFIFTYQKRKLNKDNLTADNLIFIGKDIPEGNYLIIPTGSYGGFINIYPIHAKDENDYSRKLLKEKKTFKLKSGQIIKLTDCEYHCLTMKDNC